ncbi:Protein EMBRYO SAC DEVELOPMENT ARREST 30 [Linum perenne]
MLTDKLSVDSHIRRDNGSCPLMPEEVGLLLRAMGYRPNTIIYVAGSETFGGQRLLIPLRAMFSNLVDYTSFCSKQELSDLLGPETLLPPNPFKVPAAKSDAQLKEEWKRAGPRPRPLPPPPDRPIYQHEKEGWYGWITETDTEPEPSPADLRMQAHRLLWDALDYIVSLEADTFFPGFNNDGSRWPDFSSLVMGQRLYESPASRTVRPDRQACHNLDPSNLQNLPACLISYNASEDGVARQSQLSKPASFLSHPFPECSCRMPSSVGVPTMLKDKQGRVVFGGEDECPKWMQSNQESAVVESGAAAEGGSNEDAESEYENEFVETQDLDAKNNNSHLLFLPTRLLSDYQSRCTPTKVVSALGSINPEKRAVLDRLGLSQLGKLQIKNIICNGVVLVLNNYDLSNHSVRLPGNRTWQLSASDYATVYGLPMGPEVVDLDDVSDDDAIAYVNSVGLGGQVTVNGDISWPALEAAIRDTIDPVSWGKLLFLLCSGCIFVPTTGRLVDCRFLKFLSGENYVELFKSYNWCQYFVDCTTSGISRKDTTNESYLLADLLYLNVGYVHAYLNGDADVGVVNMYTWKELTDHISDIDEELEDITIVRRRQGKRKRKSGGDGEASTSKEELDVKGKKVKKLKVKVEDKLRKGKEVVKRMKGGIVDDSSTDFKKSVKKLKGWHTLDVNLGLISTKEIGESKKDEIHNLIEVCVGVLAAANQKLKDVDQHISTLQSSSSSSSTEESSPEASSTDSDNDESDGGGAKTKDAGGKDSDVQTLSSKKKDDGKMMRMLRMREKMMEKLDMIMIKVVTMIILTRMMVKVLTILRLSKRSYHRGPFTLASRNVRVHIHPYPQQRHRLLLRPPITASTIESVFIAKLTVEMRGDILGGGSLGGDVI